VTGAVVCSSVVSLDEGKVSSEVSVTSLIEVSVFGVSLLINRVARRDGLFFTNSGGISSVIIK